MISIHYLRSKQLEAFFHLSENLLSEQKSSEYGVEILQSRQKEFYNLRQCSCKLLWTSIMQVQPRSFYIYGKKKDNNSIEVESFKSEGKQT